MLALGMDGCVWLEPRGLSKDLLHTTCLAKVRGYSFRVENGRMGEWEVEIVCQNGNIAYGF